MLWKEIILHHTVTAATTTVESIRQAHKAKGWVDIGYNYLVDFNGNVFTGRSLTIPGAHALGHNDIAIGIAAIGNFEVIEMPDKQKQGIVKLVRELMDKYSITTENVMRHKEVYSTACPGKYFPWDYVKKELESGKYMGGNSVFKDLNQCWYPELAQKAIEEGIISGYDDGTLRPRGPVDREQLWLVALRQRQVENHLLDIPDMVKKHIPSVVRIYAKNGTSQTVGSGSFVTSNIILTNAHVVGSNATVSVDTYDHHPDNGKRQGKVIKLDDNIDLALVQIDGEYTPLKLADDAIHGEFCLVLGNPGGEWQSVTFGIVAHPDRDWYIETDARINPGNSGGAVINESGELIGVPSHKITLAGFDNQNYAIRVSKVKEFIKGVV